MVQQSIHKLKNMAVATYALDTYVIPSPPSVSPSDAKSACADCRCQHGCTRCTAHRQTHALRRCGCPISHGEDFQGCLSGEVKQPRFLQKKGARAADLIQWYSMGYSNFYMSAVMKHFSARVVVSAAINETWGRCLIFMDRNGTGDWINVLLANSDFKSKRLKEDETEKRCSWTDGLSFPLNIHDFFCLFYCWSLVSSPSPACGSTSQP